MKKVCLITGVGPGTGSAMVRRFAQEYDVAMIARSEDRLKALSSELPNAHAYVCDVTNTQALKSTIAEVQKTLGDPSVVIHNAVGGAFDHPLDLDPALLQLNFDINVMSMLHLIQAVGPKMVEAGEGAIIATGNTAAYRGLAHYGGFASTKAAQRILLESTARSLGPKGVHAAYLAIDAIIDVPWARERMPDAPDDFFANPDEIAGEVWHIAHQPRSVWISDVKIRPFAEKW